MMSKHLQSCRIIDNIAKNIAFKILILKNMKKIVKLLSILSISASVGFWSCKGEQGEVGPKGDQGVQGTAGSNGTNGTNGANGKDGVNGKDGNANVEGFSHSIKVADWKDVQVTGIGNGVSSKWGGVAITNAKITTEKYVVVFVKAGQELKALPLTYTKGANESIERMDYGYQAGQLNVYYRTQSSFFTDDPTTKPLTDINIEVVLTTKTIGALLEKSNVNLNNKDAVVDFISKNM
jgi:Collagen triple helix repeat (20 copies)